MNCMLTYHVNRYLISREFVYITQYIGINTLNKMDHGNFTYFTHHLTPHASNVSDIFFNQERQEAIINHQS